MKATIQEEAELMVARFNHEDTMAACGYSDGYVRVFNLGTDNKIAEINAGTKEPGPVNTLRWRPINELNSSTTAVLLVANTNGHIYQYAAKTGKEIFHTFEELIEKQRRLCNYSANFSRHFKKMRLSLELVHPQSTISFTRNKAAN